MNKKLGSFIAMTLLVLPAPALAASAQISGSSQKVITVKPEAATGLNDIFVVYDTQGCTITFPTSNGYTANVSRYSNLGGGYAEEVNGVEREAASVSWPLGSSDMGYIVEDGSTRYYCWVVNYENHRMTLSGVEEADMRECDYSVLSIKGDASPINFYSITGSPTVLSREIHIDYTTQEFDEQMQGFRTVDTRKTFASLGNSVSISPPAYCSTYFSVRGDRFLREWGMEVTAESPVIAPVAVDCKTEAVQNGTGDADDEENPRDPSNVMGGESSGLGGSAPADISFYAYVTDGVVHYEWQMGRDPEFNNPEYRFYQQDLDYTFTEQGTFYLRFIGSNDDGTCETFGDVYTVSIGASALEIPNAFSPNGDGVNDVWKVSYRSLTDFHCEIFNRNGQRIYGFDDPSDGWDGTWHGKTVKPGVYYYVITATGADGQKYKKSGDINIINSIIYDKGTSSPD